jgi:hypothetical protein
MSLFPHLREQEQGIQKLVRMRSTDKEHWPFSRNIERSARPAQCQKHNHLSVINNGSAAGSKSHIPDFSEEDVNYESPENENEVI